VNRSARIVAATVALALAAAPLAAQAPALLKSTEFGHGPTLVLVHGLGGARTQWMPTARRLLGGYRIVMVDLPGHGESPMPDPFDLKAGAAALDQVLSRQSPESTVVVGQGIGGTLAVLAAAAHPEHVRGVIVIDASLRTPFSQVPDQQRKFFIDYLNNATPEQYADFTKRMFSSQGRDSAQGVEIHARVSQVPAANMKAYFRELMYFDGTSALKDLKVPLFFIGTSRAWPDTVTWATLAKDRGYEGASHVTTRRIANSGVMIASDQPDSLAAALDAFAKSALVTKK